MTKFNPNHLIGAIIELHENDDEDPEIQSGYLVRKYEEADLVQKEAMDYVSICICGYSIKTILAGKAQFNGLVASMNGKRGEYAT